MDRPNVGPRPRTSREPRERSAPRLLVLGLGLLWLLTAGCPNSDDPTDLGPDPEPLPPVDLVEGTTIGAEAFPQGNTAQGGQGQPIDGIGCIEQVAVHYHAHLSLFVEGERIAIPLAIGIIDPVVNDGYVVNGGCFYWMHTHDATGLIHIEPPAPGEFTLGELFDIWGQPLSTDNVAGYQGTVSVFVDGVRYQGDPRGIVFESRKHISLQVGSPLSPPPMYNFQG